MCTEADILTGKTIQTFYGGYKTEQRVIRMIMKLWFLNDKRDLIFIGPESDHWECLSVTHSLPNSVLFSKLD